MEITGYCSHELEIDHFRIGPGETWCFFGTNTSGITQFLKLFPQQGPPPEGINCPEKYGLLSFEGQQEIYERELRCDDTDFLGYLDPGTPARAFIPDIESQRDMISAFNLEHCLDKGYRQLSSGESRKLILLGALAEHPALLIIENPYDGIDKESCRELDAALSRLSELDLGVIILVNNPEDIPLWCSHLAIFFGGRMTHQGEITRIRPLLDKIPSQGARYRLSGQVNAKAQDEELIHLHRGHARYGDIEIFSDLDFLVNSGQHTLITGPNGSGKSTLLQIITGDNQNCYSNDLTLFGISRGSGESIWELKRQMGIVSPDLHRNHYIPGSCLQVVLSGYFDSIGVYQRFTEAQRNEALRWLDMINMRSRAKTSFRQLSYGEQRLCLIARALIKMPRLLILDEPTQGLDRPNRVNLLDFLEQIARMKISTILYASHRSDEFRPFFNQHLQLTT